MLECWRKKESWRYPDEAEKNSFVVVEYSGVSNAGEGNAESPELFFSGFPSGGVGIFVTKDPGTWSRFRGEQKHNSPHICFS